MIVNDPGSGTPGDPGGGGAGGDAGGYAEWVKQTINSYYQKYLGRAANPQEIQGWLSSHPNDLSGIEAGISGSDEAKAYKSKQQGPPPPPPPLGGAFGDPNGGIFSYNFHPPAQGPGLPPLPEFNPPGYVKPPEFHYDKFSAPTMQEAENEPGYAFARNQGVGALQNSAAAKGVLNTGGTLKDIIGWGDQFAQQNYQNVFNRDLSAYGQNYNVAAQNYATNTYNQYQLPYQFAYQSALDKFQPQMLGYSTTAAYNQRQNELGYDHAWQQYLQHYKQGLDWASFANTLANE